MFLVHAQHKKPDIGPGDRRQVVAWAAMAATVGLQAVGPAIVALAAPGSSPLVFHAVLMAGQAALFAAGLAVSAPRLFVDPAAGWGVLLDRRSWLSYLRGGELRVVAAAGRRWGCLAGLLRLPLLWVCVCSCDYALLAWASNVAETAAAVALYELWPLWLMWLVSRWVRTPGGHPPAAARRQMLAGAAAAVGVVLVLLSQHEQPAAMLTGRAAAAGALLGSAAGLMAAVGIAMSLVYGHIVYRRVSQQPLSAAGLRAGRDEVVLWMTMAGIAAVRAVNSLASFAVALAAASGGLPRLGSGAAVGAVLLGVALAAATVLLRVGNIKARDSAANMLLLLTPGVALGLLVLIGVELPHFGLFAAGAALIVAANVSAQRG